MNPLLCQLSYAAVSVTGLRTRRAGSPAKRETGTVVAPLILNEWGGGSIRPGNRQGRAAVAESISLVAMFSLDR
jgi:hypothetical protein